jgi:hypothetical protein
MMTVQTEGLSRRLFVGPGEHESVSIFPLALNESIHPGFWMAFDLFVELEI